MRRFIVLFLCSVIFLTGCALNKKDNKNVQSKNIRTIVDAEGRHVKVPEKINSIVCMNVGALRFTTYMQSQDLVIGVEENETKKNILKPFNYVNSHIFSKLPVIGKNGVPYEEEIIKLSPDIVVASIDGKTADALSEKLSIPVFTIPLVDDAFDNEAAKTLALLGELYNKKERADQLINYIDSIKDDLKRRTKNIKIVDKPLVYVAGINYKGSHGFEGTEEGYYPFRAIGALNISDVTGKNGAFNIALEEVLKRNPDIIFLDFNGMQLINDDYKKHPSYYNSLSAVKNDSLYSQISFRFNAINLELAFANAYYVGKVVFPFTFEDIDPIKKADDIFITFLGKELYLDFKNAGYEFKKMKLGV